MSKYIDAEKLKNFLSEINKVCPINDDERHGRHCVIIEIESFIDSLQQEQPEVDLEKLKNKAELIANEIMMGVQANKYHTCIYDKTSNDFNHSHLFRAALKGIELGLNIRKEE